MSKNQLKFIPGFWLGRRDLALSWVQLIWCRIQLSSIFDSGQCCKLAFFGKKPFKNSKRQIETFHELLPGNLVFFHFYYNGTQEIELLDHTTELYRKNDISMENFTSCVQNLTKTFRDQTVKWDLWDLCETYETYILISTIEI